MEPEIRARIGQNPGGDPAKPSSMAVIDAQIPPSPKLCPAGFSPTVRVGSAGRTSSAESQAPSQGCASVGVTHPGPWPRPIAQGSDRSQSVTSLSPGSLAVSPPSLGMRGCRSRLCFTPGFHTRLQPCLFLVTLSRSRMVPAGLGVPVQPLIRL